MTTTELEKRLTAVERELARLKNGKGHKPSHPVEALEQIHGVFENDEAFQEASRLGRRWRRAQRSHPGNGRRGNDLKEWTK